MSGKKGKWKLEKKFDCPQCGTKLEVKWKEETIKPSVPAEKKDIFEVNRDTQTSLDRITEINDRDKKETKKLRQTIHPMTTKKKPGRPKKK